MTLYTIHLSWGDTLQFRAELAQASAPLIYVDDDGEKHSTPYQTADARHRVDEAARLMLERMGNDYWLSPDDDVDVDDEGNTTYAGMVKDDYLDSLIVRVDRDDE